MVEAAVRETPLPAAVPSSPDSQDIQWFVSHQRRKQDFICTTFWAASIAVSSDLPRGIREAVWQGGNAPQMDWGEGKEEKSEKRVHRKVREE